MMKKFASALVAGAALMALAGTAEAADLPYEEPMMGAWYLRGDIGVGISRKYSGFGSDTAMSWGGGFGYRFNDMLRADLTYDGAGRYKKKGHKLWTHSVMANGYIDLPIDFALRPYVGAGVGYGWGRFRNKSHDGLALAGMAGVTYEFNPSWAIDVGYKFRNITRKGQDLQDHMIRGGLRYSFGGF